jgi:hypothetical protein
MVPRADPSGTSKSTTNIMERIPEIRRRGRRKRLLVM